MSLKTSYGTYLWTVVSCVVHGCVYGMCICVYEQFCDVFIAHKRIHLLIHMHAHTFSTNLLIIILQPTHSSSTCSVMMIMRRLHPLHKWLTSMLAKLVLPVTICVNVVIVYCFLFPLLFPVTVSVFISIMCSQIITSTKQ